MPTISQINTAIKLWLVSASSLAAAKVLRANSNNPLPARPYITYQIISYERIHRDEIMQPVHNISVLTFDADLISGNQFDCSINGVAITPVVFATDNDTTMDAIAAEIASNADVDTAVATAEGQVNKNIITITATGTDGIPPVTVTNALVTLGASQATVTVRLDSDSYKIHGNRDITVSVNVYDDDALQTINTIADTLDGVVEREDLDDADIAYVSRGPITDLTALNQEGTEYKERRQIDIFMRTCRETTNALAIGVVNTVEVPDGTYD